MHSNCMITMVLKYLTQFRNQINRGSSVEYIDMNLLNLFLQRCTHHIQKIYLGYIMVNSPNLDRTNIIQNIKMEISMLVKV